MQPSGNQVKQTASEDGSHPDKVISDSSPTRVLKSLSNLYDTELAEARKLLHCEELNKELAEARNAAYQDELSEMKDKLDVVEAKLCAFGNSKFMASGEVEADVDMGSTTPGSSDTHIEDETPIVSMLPALMEAAVAAQRRPGPLTELTVDQVAEWAALTPLPFEVVQLLRDHAISGDILETLSNDDMIEMGMHKLGWRRQLEICRRELMEQLGKRQAAIVMDVQSGLTKPSTDGTSSTLAAKTAPPTLFGESCAANDIPLPTKTALPTPPAWQSLRNSGNLRRSCESPQRSLHRAMRSPGATKLAPVGATPSSTATRSASRATANRAASPSSRGTTLGAASAHEKSRAARVSSTSPGASKVACVRNCSTTTTKPRSATPDFRLHGTQGAYRCSESANTAAVRSCAKLTVSRLRTATPELPRASQDKKEINTPKPRLGTPGSPSGTIITLRPRSGTPSLQRRANASLVHA